MTQPKPSVKFDIADSSTISIRVIDENGQPLRGLGLSVMVRFGSHVTHACVVNPILAGGKRQQTNWFLTEHDNGTMRVGQLSSGKYEVSVTNGDWKIERSVDLAANANAVIEWTVNASGKVTKTSVSR